MKKIIACLLVMVMCLTMFIGCGSKKKNTDSQTDATKKVDVKKDQVKKDTKKIPIRFMYWNKEESLSELIKLINEKIPEVDFEFQFVDTKSFQTVYKTQMSAGEGPDLLCMESIPLEVAAGYALDITDQPFMKKNIKIPLLMS